VAQSHMLSRCNNAIYQNCYSDRFADYEPAGFDPGRRCGRYRLDERKQRRSNTLLFNPAANLVMALRSCIWFTSSVPCASVLHSTCLSMVCSTVYIQRTYIMEKTYSSPIENKPGAYQLKLARFPTTYFLCVALLATTLEHRL